MSSAGWIPTWCKGGVVSVECSFHIGGRGIRSPENFILQMRRRFPFPAIRRQMVRLVEQINRVMVSFTAKSYGIESEEWSWSGGWTFLRFSTIPTFEQPREHPFQLLHSHVWHK